MLACVDDEANATALIIACDGGVPGWRCDDEEDDDEEALDTDGIEEAVEALIEAGGQHTTQAAAEMHSQGRI